MIDHRQLTRVYVQWLFHDSPRVELCRIEDRRIESVWEDDPARLIAKARAWSRTGNLFTTLHRIDPAALAEHLGADPQGKRTPDVAIQRYTRLFFDLDPARPKGLAATAEELQAAERRGKALVARLTLIDWPAPLVGVSGNGCHVQYRTALPNTDEFREILATVYQGLHREFHDDEVSFDRTVRNPGRLAPLYGSIKRKGPNHSARPHRQSSCVIPAEWRQVTPAQVAALADLFARQAPVAAEAKHGPSAASAARSGARVAGQGDYATLDVVAWFQAHDAYVGPLGQSSKTGAAAHGVRCPWSDQHSMDSPAKGGDTVVFETDGSWPGFNCRHSHCDGRTIREVMALWGDADQFCRERFHPVRRMAS